MEHYILKCPHCNDYVLIYKKEFNCKIFRHAYYRDSFKQINPHMKKEECVRLLDEGFIYGCGKPFQIIEKEKSIVLKKCNYI